VKTPIEIRQHVLDKIGASGANLLGTRTYGATVEPAILILPDPQYEDSGMTPPSIINGYPVTYQGIEVVIYDGIEGTEYSSLLNNEVRLDSQILILFKDWNDNDSNDLNMAVLLVSKGLPYILKTLTPPSNPIDQAPLLKSIILVVGYAGYL
jgi:hypothetical protein